MPITVSGMASGINTHEMVEKLVELEKAPIERLQQSEKSLKAENEALEELRRKTKKLQDSLRTLSGFEAAFEQKKVISDPPGFVEGIANKKALPGNYKIEIIALASSLAFSSKPINKDLRIKGGRLVFNNKSAEFKGGSLSEFRDFLNKYFKDDIGATIVHLQQDQSMLVIESKKTGRNSELKIEDPDGLLNELDMYKSGPPQLESQEKKNPPEVFSLLFDKKDLKVHKGQFGLSPDKKTLELKANSLVEMDLSRNPDIEKFAKLRFSFEPKKKEAEHNKKQSPLFLEEGYTETIQIRGIELSTYTIARGGERPAPPKTSKTTVTVVYDGEEETKEVDTATEIELSLKKTPKGLRFSSAGQEVLVANLKALPQETTSPSTSEKGEFPHLIRKGQNARIRFSGVEMERESNEDIKDLLEGVSLNLRKASPGEEIEIRIVANSDKALEQIKSFVEAYNELITYAQDSTRSAEIKEVGKFHEMKQKQGILVTNATVRSLIQGLKMHVSNPYPSSKEPRFRILADIGITTGAIGAKWEDISRGLLQINEEKLQEVLANHPLSVKELFVSDTNSDNRPDNGFAYTTEKFLEPYTRLTGGIITTQINNNKEKLKQIAKEIEKVEQHAKTYENKLKQKFGYMEANVAKQKATGKFLSDRLNPPKKED